MYDCRCSYIEIYNEAIFDLLDASGRVCNLREDTKKGSVYVEDCTVARISSPQEALEIFALGAQNRHVASTAMNRESSRSHSVFTIFVQSRREGEQIVDVREARFNLVDLAGSERQQLTGTVGVRLKEAGNINKSLLALSNVINALVETAGGRPRHVHYRDSKLTFLLKDSLGGNSKTCIVANVSPSPFSQAETLSTLRFAQRAKMIKNQAIVNKNIRGDIGQLQAEVKRLQAELELARTNTEATSSLERRMSCISVSHRGWTEEDRRTLKVALERQTELSSELIKLRERLEVTEELSRRKDYCIQAERMIRKLKEKNINTDDERVEALQEEIRVLNGMLEHHPEVVRFAIDNTRLRERLGQVDQLTMDDFDALQSQLQTQQQHIDTLTKRLVDQEEPVEGEQKRRRLSVDTKILELQGNLEMQSDELASLRTRLADLEAEQVHLKSKLAAITEERNDLQAEKENLYIAINVLEQDKIQLKSVLVEKDNIHQVLLGGKADLERALKEAENGLLSMQSQSQAIEESHLVTEAQLRAQLEQTTASSLSQVENLTRLHQAKLDHLAASHQSELEELKRSLSIENSRLKETISKLERSLEETQLNIGSLTSELESTRSKTRDLSKLLEQERQKQPANNQEDQLYVLRVELAHLRKAMSEAEEKYSNTLHERDTKIAALEQQAKQADTKAVELEARLLVHSPKPRVVTSNRIYPYLIS